MFPCVMLLPRLPRGEGFPRALSPPPRPAFCAADAPHEHLHVHSRAHPGGHSFNACTSHVPAKICLPAAGGPLERWNCSVRCCGGRRCCRRCSCCCYGCCRAAAAVPRSGGWTTVKPLSDPPSWLGLRGSSTMSYGSGSVVGLSSSDGCAWVADAAGSSKNVKRGVPDGCTTGGPRVGGCRGSALQL